MMLRHGALFLLAAIGLIHALPDSDTTKHLRSQSRVLQDDPILPYTIRYSAGATEDWIDDNGLTWKSDSTIMSNGAIYSQCPLEIANTTMDNLYCKERYFNKWVHNGPFKYDIPVPRNGAYTLKLHFAETVYKAAGERVFDTWVGGKLTLRSLDIYNVAGFATALVVPIATKTTTGVISIELVPRVENPKIAAIEIIEIPDYVAPPTAAPVVPLFATRISAGATENWLDDNGVLWESDKYFGNKGDVHWTCPQAIGGTELDGLYCKDRYFNKWVYNGPYRYDIPVPQDGFYSVKLHFAEVSYQAIGQRVFDVLVGGKIALQNFDIFKEAGYLTAYIVPIVAKSNNATISIEFVSNKENPKICAIEVAEIPNYVPPPTAAPITASPVTASPITTSPVTTSPVSASPITKSPIIAQPTRAPVVPLFATRISAGSTENWFDSNGTLWESDKYFGNKGDVHWTCPQSISGTELDNLYCKDRYFNKLVYNGPYRYDIPVPKDSFYSVKLHFAEVSYQAIGQRVFDVIVNGKVTIKNLDIYKEAGYLTAFIVPIVAMSKNSTISIEFVSNVENPKICALEIVEIPNYVPPPTAAPVAPPKLPFSTRISTGATEDWVDGNGTVWESDKYFGGKGEIFTKCPLQIDGTVLDTLYCKERFFNQFKYSAPYQYEIPVPKVGAYSVKLHFAEITYQLRGERIFDVLVNGKLVLGSLDIFAEVGYLKAFIFPTITQSTTGFIVINLAAKVEHPKICAIEIVELPDYVFPPTAAPVVRPFEILINAGAVNDYYEKSTGRVWLKDDYFIGGGQLFKRHYDIIGTVDDEIFHIERWGDFRYEIPVPPGTYEVTLHLTELHFRGVGQRLFNVAIEDQITYKNIDMIKMTGVIRTAMKIQYTLPVVDGLLSLLFSESIPKVDQPKLSGLEVKFVSTSTTAINPFPILINCGGSQFTERNSTRTWISDRHFINGNVYDYTTAANKKLSNQVYYTGRYGAFRYEIPVPVGRYEVTLHFAETSLSGVGTRIFNVVVEDIVSYRNVDLVKIGGGFNFKPITMKSDITVTDGLLSVVLTFASPARNSPTISGIEINLSKQPTNAPIVAPPTRSPSRAPIFVPIGSPVPVSAPLSMMPRNCSIPRVSKAMTCTNDTVCCHVLMLTYHHGYPLLLIFGTDNTQRMDDTIFTISNQCSGTSG
jgi:Malectin domain